MVLTDKFNEMMGKGVYSGTFVAPEEFNKYFCLDNLYSDRGTISNSLYELQPNLSIRDLAKYRNKKGAGICRYDGFVSKQSDLGACGSRSMYVASKEIVVPDEKKYLVNSHLNAAKSQSKSFVIFCYDKFWSGSRELIQDIKYADEMSESIDFCKNWLLMQMHSQCCCHIFVYGYDSGMWLVPHYKDTEALDTKEPGYETMVKLFKYNYFIKMHQMRMD